MKQLLTNIKRGYMYKETKILNHCFVIIFSISLIAHLPTIEAAQGNGPNNVCNCKGYSGVGGPRYDGVGGPAYDGVGGPAYDGIGGACYAGVGGPCYSGIGGTGKSCPAICK